MGQTCLLLCNYCLGSCQSSCVVQESLTDCC